MWLETAVVQRPMEGPRHGAQAGDSGRAFDDSAGHSAPRPSTAVRAVCVSRQGSPLMS
jgi:hypothetical protein